MNSTGRGHSRSSSVGEPSSPTKSSAAGKGHRYTASIASPQMSPQKTLSPLPPDLVSEASAPLLYVDQSLLGPTSATSVESGFGGARKADEGPALHVTSLKVNFSGFAVYVDHTGRFSALKLCDITQELLPHGSSLPAQEEGSDGQPMDSVPPTKYDIQFDLAVPGWLPASLRSRFGGTFYCLSASARFQEDIDINLNKLQPLGSALPGHLMIHGRPRGSLSPSPSASGGEGTSGTDEEPQGIIPEAPPGAQTLSSVVTVAPEAGSGSRASGNQSRGNWLSKRAKQLQAKAKAAAAASSGGSNAQAGGSESITYSKRRPKPKSEDEPGDGSMIVRSETNAIIIRRCREVVPVPVARMALIGAEGIPEVPASFRDPALEERANQVPNAPSQIPDRRGSSDPVPPTSPISQPEAESAHTAVPPTSTSGSIAPPTTPPSQGETADGSRVEPAGEVAGTGERAASTSEAPVSDSVGPPSDAVDSAETSTATAASSRATASAAPLTSEAGPSRPPTNSAAMLPPAPSALDMSEDPAKRAAAARQATASAAPVSSSAPHSSARSSSRTTVPMRHFLHRPILHPPAEALIEGDGLPFSLTLSVPSHVPVEGPQSDVLSFAIQIEVGRATGWESVRGLGGLRLREMELICLQTERHRCV